MASAMHVLALAALAVASAQDIVGCGGFAKLSPVLKPLKPKKLDYSFVKVGRARRSVSGTPSERCPFPSAFGPATASVSRASRHLACVTHCDGPTAMLHATRSCCARPRAW